MLNEGISEPPLAVVTRASGDRQSSNQTFAGFVMVVIGLIMHNGDA